MIESTLIVILSLAFILTILLMVRLSIKLRIANFTNELLKLEKESVEEVLQKRNIYIANYEENAEQAIQAMRVRLDLAEDRVSQQVDIIKQNHSQMFELAKQVTEALVEKGIIDNRLAAVEDKATKYDLVKAKRKLKLLEEWFIEQKYNQNSTPLELLYEIFITVKLDWSLPIPAIFDVTTKPSRKTTKK